MDHVEWTDALEVEIARFVDVMRSTSRDVEITTCPGWTVVDLAEHLGLIHRWAEQLVRLRSPERIDRVRSVPDRDTVNPDWIREGGVRLVATLRDANPNDPMWAWGRDHHVRFWSRRQLHETLVHRIDLELGAQVNPSADPEIAADAIDEHLTNFEYVANRSRESSALRGRGAKLALRVSDPGALWCITLDENRFVVTRDEGAYDAEVVGDALDMLLVTMRRRALEAAQVQVLGNRQLVDLWLEHSAFE